jgi:predicted dehydrogenase
MGRAGTQSNLAGARGRLPEPPSTRAGHAPHGRNIAMTEQLGVLIVGAGRVAAAHARAIEDTPEVRLVAVADVDRGRADAFAAKHGCLAFDDYRAALARDDVRLAMIGLPHHLHERATLDACAAGKHIFLEKPMANTVEECDRMIAAAEGAGIQLLVAHSQRYFATTRRAREIVQGGELGRPIFATDTWYKAFGIETRPPWFLDRAQGGGMWLMNGAHMIDRTCWVLDSEVAAVKAWLGSPIHNIAADDANMALLQLRNGGHATIVHAGFKQGVDRCEVEITCTGGMLRFDSYSHRLAVGKDGRYEPIELERVSPFAAELKNLTGAIAGREPLGVTPAWGRHIVQVLLACEESSRSGREVRIE